MPIVHPFRGTIVFFAVDREMKPFLRLFAEREALKGGRWLCGAGRILVDLLGIGKAGATSKVEALLAAGHRPERIVVAGFAGALRPGLYVGDVLAVAEIVDDAAGCWETNWPADRSGRLFTSERLVGDPREKRALGSAHAADIVDMESAAVASVCRRNSIPFGCVRVVSDDVTRLMSPRLLKLLQDGRVNGWKVLRQLIRSPLLLVELLRLAKDTRRAAKRLAVDLHRRICEQVEPVDLD